MPKHIRFFLSYYAKRKLHFCEWFKGVQGSFYLHANFDLIRVESGKIPKAWFTSSIHFLLKQWCFLRWALIFESCVILSQYWNHSNSSMYFFIWVSVLYRHSDNTQHYDFESCLILSIEIIAIQILLHMIVRRHPACIFPVHASKLPRHASKYYKAKF